MLTKILEFVKAHINDIILFIIVALLILFSFAMGYLLGKHQLKTPIHIEQSTN
jgi:hypothetical protein